MKKGSPYIIFLLIISLFFTACDTPDVYTIRGEIKGLSHDDIYLVIQGDSLTQVDTIRTRKGKFTYQGTSEGQDQIMVYMNTGSAWMTLWVNNGDKISLKGEANYPELILAKGGEINDQLTAFKEDNREVIRERGDIRDKMLQNSQREEELSVDVVEAQLASQIVNLDQILKNKAEDFIKENPSSLASLVLMQDYVLDFEESSTLSSYLTRMQGDVRSHPLFLHLEEKVSFDEPVISGKKAPAFSLKDIEDKELTLGNYHEKYLLLTFLTSWNDSSRAGCKQLSELRGKFPEKELGILTVSLDENRGDWLKLSEEEHFSWDQAVETEGWSSETAVSYHVAISDLPVSYLIDKEGVIVCSRIPLDSISTFLDIHLDTPKRNGKT